MEVVMQYQHTSEQGKAAQKYAGIFSLDLHDSNIYIYGVRPTTGEVVADTNVTGGFKSVLKRLQPIGDPTRILVLFEAGHMGYAPHRFFTKQGYVCRMIAPSSIPRRTKQAKTDRDDAINNLNFYVSGLLKTVWVPAAEDEHVRDLVRYRYSLMADMTKLKQQITALLKRKGCEYTLTKTRWTKTFYHWLEKVELPAEVRLMLNWYTTDLSQQTTRVEDLTRQLNDIFMSERYRETYCLYQVLKGIGQIYAMTLTIEFGDLARFAHPNQMMNYIGVVPRKHSSGTHDPHLSITKEGNRYLRFSCVGVAKQYRDYRFLYGVKRLECFPDLMQSFLVKCQNRLVGRYRHLVHDLKKPANVARVAVARELCGFLWEYMVKVRPQLNVEQVIRAAA
jgi:transposase